MKILEESTTKFYSPPSVFYNPAQKFNRDLSIEIINHYILTNNIEQCKILECMAASGIRSIRYLKEIPHPKKIYINDISEQSIKLIKKNLELNDISTNSDEISITQQDCNDLMYSNNNYYNIIDIDPFGSCGPFIDTALDSIKDSGLLILTSTDTSVLCRDKLKCYSKYSTVIKRTAFCHELALRSMIAHVSKVASVKNVAVEVLCSVSVDFYCRVFIKIRKEKNEARKNYEKSCFLLMCSYCGYYRKSEFNTAIPIRECTIQPKDNTSSNNISNNIGGEKRFCSLKILGPFYSQNLHDNSFLSTITAKDPRVSKFISFFLQELDVFLYYSLDDLCSKLSISCPKLSDLIAGITNRGYKVSLTHCKLNSIKTEMPYDELAEMLRDLTGERKFDYKITEGVKEYLKRFKKKGSLFSGMGPMSLPKRE